MKQANYSVLFDPLQAYLQDLSSEFAHIPAERKAQLRIVSQYIRERVSRAQPIHLIVICTHNSRRSHIGQIWLQLAATCYAIPGVSTFSGGTAATAFHPNAIAAMRRTGLQIETADTSENPVYSIEYGKNLAKQTAFSKVYQDDSNPQQGFAAILVCNSADEACPIVLGADARFVLPFEDPKAYDHSDLMEAKYDERSRQIAREFFFLMSEV